MKIRRVEVPANEGSEAASESSQGPGILTRTLVFGCGCVFFFFLLPVAAVALGLYAKNNPLSQTASNTGTAAACGIKSAVSTPSIVPQDDGIMSKTQSSNGFYYTSTFGCNLPFYRDSGDPCDGGGCGGMSLSKIQMTDGTKTWTQTLTHSDGPSYQSSLKYFSANCQMFGCDTRLQITNPKNGKAVVVVTADAGPARDAPASQGGHALIDLSYLALKAIGDPDIVKVEVLKDKNTPIGPAICTGGGGINNKVPPNFATAINEASQKTGVDSALIAATFLNEHHSTSFGKDISSVNATEPNCGANSSGAIGPMQIIDNSWSGGEVAKLLGKSSADRCVYLDAFTGGALVIKNKMTRSDVKSACSTSKSGSYTDGCLKAIANAYCADCNNKSACSPGNYNYCDEFVKRYKLVLA